MRLFELRYHVGQELARITHLPEVTKTTKRSSSRKSRVRSRTRRNSTGTREIFNKMFEQRQNTV